MHVIQMFVAFVVVIVGNHFFWLTLETHTLVASAASDPEAPIDSHHWHFAGFVGALPNSVLFHILFKKFLAPSFSLLASKVRVVWIFAAHAERRIAKITFEEPSLNKVYLLAACCVTKSDCLLSFAYVLVNSH